ncbi:MAG: LysR family transcriptional regulator [Gemmatimonadota bacterium]|nr:LysR family transcriptional regulator [Gemmatimonadota bacterium]
MRPINHRHLFYFWRVACEGGVSAAARALHVSQSAVSVQVQHLERALGHPLFDRTGRDLSLTSEGRVVLEYAEEIFRLSTELRDTLAGRIEGRPMRLVVGLSATIPNMVAFHLLEPVFEMPDPVRTVVREKRTDRLLADLATHDVDMVLTDMPIPAHLNVRAFNHPLGASPVDIWAPPLLAHRLREGFPQSLHGEPFLLPAEGYTLRKSLEEWFDRVGVQPRVFAEIEDNDLINVFAEAGAGLFAAPAVIMADIRVRYAVELVGRAEGVFERYYAITAHRKLKHPAVAAITEQARLELAGAKSPGGPASVAG